MFAAIASLFTMLTTLFQAGEIAANSLNNVAQVAEVKSAAFRDEEILKSKQRLAVLQQQHQSLPSPE
ncbi:hypothetical protein [Vreelandella venusta]|uniref:hypothetical protein n=1 Tax=Vreelandella venusta TaxID=44935 RepID=UPI001168E026|nr:hypothetical protein [Halomonas venusta]GEK52364.1 hypothetical protein HVE01_30850 [Halomonas venusta]